MASTKAPDPTAPRDPPDTSAADTARAEPTDEQLALHLQAGDPAAGEVLARRHYLPLIRYLHRLTGSDHLAEEMHQQAWLSALEHIGRFDPAAAGGGGFKSWLFRIATNKTNDHWRTRGRERVAAAGLRLITDQMVSPADDRMVSTEQQVRLRLAIDLLPEAQRQVLMLRYYGNLKFVEIAAMLGCPLNTALGRMFKANQKLRQLMGDYPGERRTAAEPAVSGPALNGKA